MSRLKKTTQYLYIKYEIRYWGEKKQFDTKSTVQSKTKAKARNRRETRSTTKYLLCHNWNGQEIKTQWIISETCM